MLSHVTCLCGSLGHAEKLDYRDDYNDYHDYHDDYHDSCDDYHGYRDDYHDGCMGKILKADPPMHGPCVKSSHLYL